MNQLWEMVEKHRKDKKCDSLVPSCSKLFPSYSRDYMHCYETSGSTSVKYKVMARHWWHIYTLQWYHPKINWQCNATFTLAIFSEHWLRGDYKRNRMCWEGDQKEGRNTKKFLHTRDIKRSGLFSINTGTILPPFLGSNAFRLN